MYISDNIIFISDIFYYKLLNDTPYEHVYTLNTILLIANWIQDINNYIYQNNENVITRNISRIV